MNTDARSAELAPDAPAACSIDVAAACTAVKWVLYVAQIPQPSAADWLRAAVDLNLKLGAPC